jgi:hypothetical protein
MYEVEILNGEVDMQNLMQEKLGREKHSLKEGEVKEKNLE